MTDIEKLQEIIWQIGILIDNNVRRSDSDFQEWHSRARRFLYKRYGAESIELKEFDKLKFTLSVYGDRTPASCFVERCCKDLRTAEKILLDYLQELKEQESAVDSTDCLSRIFTHFRKIAVELSRRHDGRETLHITDEYDVQDLLRALLSLYFDDVRPEEWTPSYAGGSARMDFLIPEIEAVIEVKKTRKDLADKKLREQLIIDIAYYQEHPKCKKIYCFVYDPDVIVRNPKAIINDLEQKHQGLVRVFIES